MILATLLRTYRKRHQSSTHHELRIQKLIASVEALQEALPSLQDVEACDCQMQGNLIVSWHCTERNPFDCHSW